VRSSGGCNLPDDLLAFDAARLFVERSAAPLALTPNVCASIADMCARLDGIPLAIELAASRLNALSPQQIAQRLDDRFSLLTAGRRGEVPRHQTLRAVIDWSHQLLTDRERKLFRRISAFAGGFTLEAAEEVCSEPGDGPSAVVDGITSLVDKSLLVVDQDRGWVRYRLLETIREYALEKLDKAGEAPATRARHAAWALHFAEVARTGMDGPDQRAWLDRLDQERDNKRAALEWFAEVEEGESLLRLVVALGAFWWIRGPVHEGRHWIDLALETTDTRSATRVRALLEGGRLALAYGDFGKAWSLANDALHLATELGNEGLASVAATGMGLTATARGNVEEARQLWAKALELARRTGDPSALAFVLRNRAWGYVEAGDFSAARADLEELLGVATVSAPPQQYLMVILVRGVLASDEGRHEDACRLLEEGSRLARELRNQWMLANVCWHLGRAATRLGDHALAHRALDEGLLVARERGDDWVAALNLMASAELAIAEEHLDLAESRADDALRLIIRAGDQLHIPGHLDTLAVVAAAKRQYQRAARLLGAAEIMRERMHHPIPPADKPRYEQVLHDVQAGLDRSTFEAAWAEGRALSFDVVREALETRR
jgi:non-specific serine/threonine protein kinase